MQRIDPSNPKPKRLMLLLDDKRYFFVTSSADGDPQFLRDLVYQDIGKARKRIEKGASGRFENRINLILTDMLDQHISKIIDKQKVSRSSYMRELIDHAMEAG